MKVRFEKILNNPKSTAEQKQQAATLINFLDDDKTHAANGRIMTRAVELSNRVTLIYIPDKNGKSEASRGWRLAHELGHLIQFVYLDALPTEVRTEILDALKEPGVESTEVFANYMAGQLAIDNAELTGPDTSVEGAFAEIVKALKQVYAWAKDAFGVAPSEKMRTVEGFISALNMYADVQTGKRFDPPSDMTELGKRFFKELERANAGPYMRNGTREMTTAEFEEATRDHTEDQMFQNYVEDIQNWARRVREDPVRGLASLIRTADSELRSMGLGAIADKFHARPVSTASSHTIFRDIMIEMAPWEKQLATVLDAVPGSRIGLWEMMFNKVPTAKHLALRAERDIIIEALLLRTDVSTLSPEHAHHVTAIRNYFIRIHKWYTDPVSEGGMGLTLDKVDDYYPMMLDTLKIDKNRNDFMQRLKNDSTFTESEAQEARMKLTRDEDGGLVNGFQAAEQTSEFFGPGLASKLHRAKGKWTDALRASLVEGGYYQEDIATTMLAYTHMLVRRGVWQRAFQDKAPSINKLARYKKHSIDAKSPIAQLLLDVHEADLNESQRARVLKDILPAYAGQLGLRTNSHIRKLGAGIIIYQNLRILAFAIFSQLVDVGTLTTRGSWADAQAAMKGIMDKATREEAFIMLQEAGAMRLGLTEHVLNDQALNTFMTGKAKRINDLFFKYNGMEGWTNYMRAMGLISGRSFMKRNAAAAQAGDVTAQRYMDELGMGTSEDLATIVDWDGHSTDNKDIQAALGRYIDESMIRPEAPIRAVWASDPGYIIFSHLKGFMWGFHETFLRRVGREYSIHQNLLPLVMLGMMALPFAAVGYELRRALLGSGTQAPEGFDYIKEVIERSGLPGMFQPVLDMEQAADFGKPWGLGVAGPSVEQLYDFYARDYESWLPKALPIVAAAPGMRGWVKENMIE